jgi:hypothetical protein
MMAEAIANYGVAKPHRGGRPVSNIFLNANPAIEKLFASAGFPKKVMR